MEGSARGTSGKEGLRGGLGTIGRGKQFPTQATLRASGVGSGLWLTVLLLALLSAATLPTQLTPRVLRRNGSCRARFGGGGEEVVQVGLFLAGGGLCLGSKPVFGCSEDSQSGRISRGRYGASCPPPRACFLEGRHCCSTPLGSFS